MTDPADHVVARFRARVRSLRKVRCMSQDTLATELGVDRTTIAKIELGTREIRLQDALRICSVLGIELNDALSEERLALRVDVA